MIGNKNTLLKEAFSLIEVIISVTLFAIIILSTTQIFKLVIDGQRGAIAAQNVEESLKYFSEVTGKEMRMAQKNSDNACLGLGVPVNKIFKVTPVSTNSDRLSFKNRYGECITYSLGLDSDGQQRFKIQRGTNFGWITPAKIKIDNLRFVVNDTSTTQPTVTINLRAHATDQEKFLSDMTIQTSIASRYYK